MQVPFVSLDLPIRELRAELTAAFHRVGDERQYIMGPELERFEEEAAAFCGTRYALAFADGSAALFLSPQGTRHRGGDEVSPARILSSPAPG